MPPVSERPPDEVHLPRLGGRLEPFQIETLGVLAGIGRESGAVNLVGRSGVGKGTGQEPRRPLPDEDGPPEVLAAACHAINHGENQYPPARGIATLREAIAGHQATSYGLKVDPESEVLVTTGATEAMAASVLALTQPGDEVVMFEPYYDAYPQIIELAGARRRVVSLRAPQWNLDADELWRAVGPRTRLIILNSPHNPTGRVSSAEELALIAEVCREADLIALTDEVYEHMIFEPRHVPLASLPGMRERTVTVSSAAKTLSVTGWKIGWAVGPPTLIDKVAMVKEVLTFAGGAPLQHGVAAGLRLPPARLDAVGASLQARRDLLCDGLERLGWNVVRPHGTYFATADATPFGYPTALDFCRALAAEGTAVIVPVGTFCDDPDAAGQMVRLSFCQPPQLIEEALRRLPEVP